MVKESLQEHVSDESRNQISPMQEDTSTATDNTSLVEYVRKII